MLSVKKRCHAYIYSNERESWDKKKFTSFQLYSLNKNESI